MGFEFKPLNIKIDTDAFKNVTNAILNAEMVKNNPVINQVSNAVNDFEEQFTRTDDTNIQTNNDENNYKNTGAETVAMKNMMSDFDTTIEYQVQQAKYNTTINNYLDWAESIADDPIHGYSKDDRDGPNYDCSSLVYFSLLNAGFTKKQLGDDIFYTGSMGKILEKAGFEKIKYDKSKLKKGDIVVDPTEGYGHTVMIYSADGDTVTEVAAHEDKDKASGDSSGKEISVNKFKDKDHNYKYIYIYRLPEPEEPENTIGSDLPDE